MEIKKFSIWYENEDKRNVCEGRKWIEEVNLRWIQLMVFSSSSVVTFSHGNNENFCKKEWETFRWSGECNAQQERTQMKQSYFSLLFFPRSFVFCFSEKKEVSSFHERRYEKSEKKMLSGENTGGPNIFFIYILFNRVCSPPICF